MSDTNKCLFIFYSSSLLDTTSLMILVVQILLAISYIQNLDTIIFKSLRLKTTTYMLLEIEQTVFLIQISNLYFIDNFNIKKLINQQSIFD